MHFICGIKHLYSINLFPPVWKNEKYVLDVGAIKRRNCPRARNWFSQLVAHKKTVENHTHSICEGFSRSCSGRCKTVWASYELDDVFPAESLRQGSHWRRGQRGGAEALQLDTFWFPRFSFQTCINQWMEPIIKHTSKAAPHLSFRPEQKTLRTARCLFGGVEDETDDNCFTISYTHWWDPGFFANMLQVCCLYVDI